MAIIIISIVILMGAGGFGIILYALAKYEDMQSPDVGEKP